MRICIQTLQILSVWDTSYSHDGGDVSSQGGDGGGGINQHPVMLLMIFLSSMFWYSFP